MLHSFQDKSQGDLHTIAKLNLMIDQLKEKLAEKEEAVISQRQIICDLISDIKHLKELNRLGRLYRFASSKSEKDPSHQLLLLNEAELGSAMAEEEAKLQDHESIRSHTRSSPVRKPLPETLERVDEVHELSHEERICSCGGHLEKIGEEVTEKLDYVPAKVRVLRDKRIKYACKSCEEVVRRAPGKKELIPKSFATPGLLASVAVSKYADSLPLYRQEQIFQRQGIDLPRNTLASWMIKLGEALTPLMNLCLDELRSSRYLQMDESKLQVLKEPGRPPTSLSWIWQVCRPGPKPIIVFEYDPSRDQTVPIRVLEDFKGYLQCDGYAGYNAVASKQDVRRVGCAYHIRRKFFEVLKSTKEKPATSLANHVLEEFKKLFAIESLARSKGLTSEDRHLLRQDQASPIMNDLRNTLEKHSLAIPPKSTLGRAVSYALKEWPHFERYLEDGILEIGTIIAENKFRTLAVGRKNWLFCDTVGGANASAALYSMIETAKANGLEPFVYLKYLCSELPKASTLEDYEALLPWKVNPADF